MSTSRFNIFKTTIDALKLVQRKPIFDKRGFFERLYCFEELKDLINGKNIIQINRSYTKLTGTVRGMHLQKPPYAEIKMVLCLKGKVFDVAVDFREGSPTFLKYHAEILSEDNNYMLIIPEGFAHGFQTLEDNCEILYFTTAQYNSEFEIGLNPMDPILNIKWPIKISVISEKDKSFPFIDNNFSKFA